MAEPPRRPPFHSHSTLIRGTGDTPSVLMVWPVALFVSLYLVFGVASFALAYKKGAFIPRPREGPDARTPRQVAAHRGLLISIVGVSGGMAASIAFLATSSSQTGLREVLFFIVAVHAVPVFSQ